MSKDAVHAADDLALEAVPLPACLALRKDGAVVVTGHRVTLFAFLDAVNDLKRRQLAITPSQLEPIFPTIDRRRLDEVLEFIAQNPAKVQQYLERQRHDAEENRKQHTSIGPAIDLLRQRQRDAMR